MIGAYADKLFPFQAYQSSVYDNAIEMQQKLVDDTSS